jgi:hypothetical protein
VRKRAAGQVYDIRVGFVGDTLNPLNTTIEVQVRGHDTEGTAHTYQISGRGKDVVMPDIDTLAEAVYRLIRDGIKE